MVAVLQFLIIIFALVFFKEDKVELSQFFKGKSDKTIEHVLGQMSYAKGRSFVIQCLQQHFPLLSEQYALYFHFYEALQIM